MTDYLKQFWGVLVSLAAVAGFYVGAKAVNLTYIFWIVFPATLVIVSAPRVLRGLGELNVRVRNYPSLLRRIAEAQLQTTELESDKQRLAEQLGKAEERGRQIAYKEVQGSIAAFYGEPPEVVAIADDAGELAVVGKYSADNEPIIGAWYTVVTAETGTHKGVVEIIRLDKQDRRAWMRCVEPTVLEFWKRLAERASYDETAPNIILVKYRVDLTINAATEVDQSNSREVDEV